MNEMTAMIETIAMIETSEAGKEEEEETDFIVSCQFS
jgi:hypothetical protein